jgi:hypothetical protein
MQASHCICSLRERQRRTRESAPISAADLSCRRLGPSATLRRLADDTGELSGENIVKGFGPFLIGAVLGGAGVFASLSYHFVHTKEGVQKIPKLSPTFSDIYVDARAYTAADWQKHKAVTAAILRANKGAIIGDAAVDQAVQAVQGLLPEVTRAPFEAPQR